MTDDTTERRAVAMAVADGVDPVAWSPRAKFARRYLRMARAVAESDKKAEIKVMPRYPRGDTEARNAVGEMTLVGNMQRLGAAKLHDYVRAGIAGLDEASDIWRAMWDAAPWLPGEGE